ncbi:MAG TPA: carboxypeptidase-like regulatory domain-containing protein [Thermoanaerobaculia bacterium]|nr:carboxypeptidase-like regulatory domain-containing protein [Thermoanaerobaculia bacterium]
MPSVAVSLLAPAETLDGELIRVEARQPADVDALQHSAIHVGEPVVLQALSMEPLDVVLIVGPWRFRERIDLSNGVDEKVVFDLHPIVVSGEVFYGRERAANAEVAFEADDGHVRVTSDDAGRYRATLWRGNDAELAQVTVPGRTDRPSSRDSCRSTRAVLSTFTCRARTVRIVDEESSRAIPAADVSAANVFTHLSGEEMKLMQRATTDTDGVAQLAPLRRGTLEVRASAKGYVDSRTVDGGHVEHEESERQLEVRLRPAEKWCAFRCGWTMDVRLPTPSCGPSHQRTAFERGSGAHQRRRGNGRDSAQHRWRYAAHPIAKWRECNTPIQPGHSRTGAAAGRCATDPYPGRHAVHARRTLDHGLQLTGPAVTFLTWSSEVTDGNGDWVAENLSRQPLRVLARHDTPEFEIVAGMRNANAAIVPYPWPPSVTLRAVK